MIKYKIHTQRNMSLILQDTDLRPHHSVPTAFPNEVYVKLSNYGNSPVSVWWYGMV